MPLTRIALTPVISATLYAAGDAVGGLLEFPMAVGYGGKSGIIRGVEIIDKAALAVGLTLQLFDRTFTASTNDLAYAPSDADALNAIANIVFLAGDFAGGANNKIAHKADLNIPFTLPPAGTSLFGQLFTQGGPTYGAADALVVVLYVEER